MRYPAPLSRGSKVGITAPSSAVPPNLEARLDLAIENLEKRGFTAVEGSCLRSPSQEVDRCFSPNERAADFMNLYCNEEIEAIHPPWGGELLIDILDLLDWDLLKTIPPKWLIGFSDTSTLLLPFTQKLDIATLHGTNLMDSVESQVDPLSSSIYTVLGTPPGDMINQEQSLSYQKEFLDYEKHPNSGFKTTEDTRWHLLGEPRDLRFSGRLIGGCLDTIVHLAGPPFGRIPDFNSRYRSEGIILHLEHCEMTPNSLHRSLMQLKLAGWFEHLTGILFGRSQIIDLDFPSNPFFPVIESILGSLDIPILVNVDIGHIPPQMSIVNGAKGIVIWEQGKGKLIQEFI